jgi:hypothetical protein
MMIDILIQSFRRMHAGTMMTTRIHLEIEPELPLAMTMVIHDVQVRDIDDLSAKSGLTRR